MNKNFSYVFLLTLNNHFPVRIFTRSIVLLFCVVFIKQLMMLSASFTSVKWTGLAEERRSWAEF